MYSPITSSHAHVTYILEPVLHDSDLMEVGKLTEMVARMLEIPKDPRKAEFAASTGCTPRKVKMVKHGPDSTSTQ